MPRLKSPIPSEFQARQRRSGVRRRRFRRRRARAVAVLPTLFTLGNLIAGFASIFFASQVEAVEIGSRTWSSLAVAGMLIFIGMFFDAIDGYVARLTRSASDLGAQLDSLADIVTFGVAPAYMTLKLVSIYYQSSESPSIISPAHDDAFARVFWVIGAIYVSCTALRLARFSVESVNPGSDDHLLFRGLPSPGAAGCIASLILLHQHRLAGLSFEWIPRMIGLGMAFIMLLCAVGMVSRVPYVHVVNRYIRGHASFGYIVSLTFILAVTVFFPQEMLAMGFTAYALGGPARILTRTWKRSTRVHSAPARPESNRPAD